MGEWSRRRFVKSAGAGVALTAAPGILAGAAGKSPAGGRVRHAVIGTGGRGRGHCRLFDRLPDCRVVAVCDVDPGRRKKAAGELPNPEKASLYEDYRRLLDRADVDTVSIATCDHWHVPVALAALAAGKHVYVEKPCSHNVHESNVLVEAARKTGLCVQHGTQSRSHADMREGVRRLREGVIGAVRAAKAINHQRRGPIGRAGPTDPPPGVNYDLWLGPAPKHRFTRNRWHYNWHWFWDYGTGDLGNDGIHQVDVARWGLGKGYPERVVASGGQVFYDDDHQTPDIQNVVFEYGDCHLIYEMRLWTPYELEGHHNGVVFYGDTGWMEVGRGGVVVHRPDGAEERIRGEDTEGMIENFIAAVKADDPSHLFGPIQAGAVSANLCHLGNIGVRLGGRRLVYDPEAGEMVGDAEAGALLRRDYREPYALPSL